MGRSRDEPHLSPAATGNAFSVPGRPTAPRAAFLARAATAEAAALLLLLVAAAGVLLRLPASASTALLPGLLLPWGAAAAAAGAACSSPLASLSKIGPNSCSSRYTSQ